MLEPRTRKEREELSQLAGEMAANRVFSLLHERIEELRERGELSYHDIAERIGATDQQISHWLSAPRNMTARSLGRLFMALEAHLLFELEKFENIGGHNHQQQPHQDNATLRLIDPKPVRRALPPTPGEVLVRTPRILQDAD